MGMIVASMVCLINAIRTNVRIDRCCSLSLSASIRQTRVLKGHTTGRLRGYILGIESSCDDTGVAIVNQEGHIAAEAIVSQTDIHTEWGGVVPRLAKIAHEEAMTGLLESVLSQNALSLDAVAVTVGPGLSLCLRVGVEAAMRISADKNIPLIPVHHMEAHALIGRMQHPIHFPFLCLLVSGGHNLLLVVHDIGVYTQLGTSLDDSLGEAYDKVARMLNLDPRPSGGAALEAEARNGNPMKYAFKIPMQQYHNCDFSYSGLKTSVRMTIDKEIKEHQELNSQTRSDIAASFQFIAVEHLRDKCSLGIQWAQDNIPGLNKTIVIAGGVAANAFVRQQLEITAMEKGMEIISPPPRLCTDNGVMVAWTGIERFTMGLIDRSPIHSIDEDTWIDVRPRWPLTDRLAFNNQNKKAPKKKRMHISLTTMTEDRLSSLTTLCTSATV